MNESYVWLAILGLTVVTLVTRSSFLVLGDRFPLPERVQHALRYAPACALAALIAPEMMVVQGQFAGLANPKLIGGAVAIAVMLASRSMIATMAAGMIAFTAMRLF
ncbi:MAG: AzlD domain-containing protein [Burkholderiaceae bacterium]